MSTDFSYHAEGRKWGTCLSVLGIWLGLLGLWLGLDAHPLIIVFLGLFTLPACWDFLHNAASGLTLTSDTLSWYSGKRRAAVAFEEIDTVRLDTRLDFSVKATLVLTTGAKIRLPFECTPPHQQFEDALNAQGLKTRRTHFQLMQ